MSIRRATVGLICAPIHASALVALFFESLFRAPSIISGLSVASAAVPVALSRHFLGRTSTPGRVDLLIRVAHLICGFVGSTVVAVVGLLLISGDGAIPMLIGVMSTAGFISLLLAPPARSLLRVDVLHEPPMTRGRPWLGVAIHIALIVVAAGLATVTLTCRMNG
jgi:hypothetical protein